VPDSVRNKIKWKTNKKAAENVFSTAFLFVFHILVSKGIKQSFLFYTPNSLEHGLYRQIDLAHCFYRRVELAAKWILRKIVDLGWLTEPHT
jgi:hypothetical protein